MERAQGQLERLRQAADQGPELYRLLNRPTFAMEKKLAAVADLLGEPLVSPLDRLIALLVNGRVEALGVADEVFRELVDRAAGVVRARVRTALPLPDDQADRLAAALSEWLGEKVVLERQVDPETIGGVLVEVGDRRLDASLRGRLGRLQQRLSA